MQLKQLPLCFQFWVVCTNFVLPFFASGVSLSPKRALIFLATCSKNYNAMVNGASDGRGRRADGRGHSGKSVAPRRTRNSSSIVVIFSLAADGRTETGGRDGDADGAWEGDRPRRDKCFASAAPGYRLIGDHSIFKCKRILPNKTLSDLFDQDQSKVLKGEKTKKYL